jgi:uncharacterized protein with von Willebrand factor type A (vWA) domain
MDLAQQVDRVRDLAVRMRQAGCAIGPSQLAEALLAVTLVAPDQESQRLALRVTLARDQRALTILDQLFPWLLDASAEADQGAVLESAAPGLGRGVPIGHGAGAAPGPTERVAIPAASPAAGVGREALPAAAVDDDLSQGWVAPFLSWADRVGGPRATRGRRLDLRRTLRRSLTTGGEAFELIWRRHPVRRQSLVILDGSRSMQQWASQLLAVGRALRRRRPDTEVFAFSAETSRLSDRLSRPGLSLPAASWGSGTRIAVALDRVRAGAGLARRSHLSTVVVSDALESGPAMDLGQALARLRRRSAVITWVNPLADAVGYRPLTSSAQEASRAADRYLGLYALMRPQRGRSS